MTISRRQDPPAVNPHYDAADALAKEGARKLRVPNYIPSSITLLGNTVNDKTILLLDAKVLYRALPKTTKAALHAPGADHKSNLTAHRDRPALLALQLEHRKKLLEAKTERDFWKAAKGMMTPKRPQSGFMLYKRMVYIVRHESETSTLFRALLGILIGDTTLPDPLDTVETA
jgi:hypothetical protein